MAKSMDTKKEVKKTATKSLKEKRAEKKEKKAKGWSLTGWIFNFNKGIANNSSAFLSFGQNDSKRFE